MAIIVKKFGGTSLGSLERIKAAADIIISEIKNKNQVIVVASAMAGATDRLVGLSKLISNLESVEQQMELDAILATGEKVSSGLLSLAIMDLGYKSRSWQGWQIPIYTNGSFTNSKINRIEINKIKDCLNEGLIPVITGFQGLYEGRITTLGRGGSDTTAAAVAAAIKADRCDIYTDVDGVFTADPRLVPKAKRLDRISFAEVLELADAGAKVLHKRCIEIACKYQINLRVLSSFKPNTGTLITDEKMENAKITGIVLDKNSVLFKVETNGNTSKVLAKIGEVISSNNININAVFASDGHVYLQCVNLYKTQVSKFLEKNKISYTAEDDCYALAIVGVGVNNDPEVQAKIWNFIVKEKLQPIQINTQSSRVNILAKPFNEAILAKLHTILELDAA